MGELKNSVIDLFDRFNNIVSNDILSYIDNNLNEDFNKLEKSIGIYLLLGDVLCYSPEFAMTYNYDVVKPVREVNLEKNEIICKNWAILYTRILKKYNIFARVEREKEHYRVIIPLNGVLYSCDATGYGGYDSYYNISDIARIKFGFRIERFIVSTAIDPYDIVLFTEKFRELNCSINLVYERQNRKFIKKERISKFKKNLEKLITKNYEGVGLKSREDVFYRVKLINRFWRLNITTSKLEKMQLFNNFFYDMFFGFEDYEKKSYNLYSKNNGELSIYKLFVIKLDDEYLYFLDDGKKFVCYDASSLLLEFINKNIITDDLTNIMGINEESKYVYVLKK